MLIILSSILLYAEIFHSKNIFKEDGMNMRDTVIETQYRTGRRSKWLEFLVWETGGRGDGCGGI